MKFFSLLLFFLITCTVTAQPTLVKNIKPEQVIANGNWAVTMGSYVYFTHNTTLWKTNGVSTSLIKNNVSEVVKPILLSSNLYFAAKNTTTGLFDLWKTNGTTAGTLLVKEINATESATFGQPVLMNGVLYFAAKSSTGTDLWRSNGTAAGTTIVANMPSDYNALLLTYNLTPVGNILYFETYSGISGTYQLWKSDGTTAGTTSLISTRPHYSELPAELVAVGNTLYFTADPYLDGLELWKSNGTTAGTVMVKDICSLGGSNPKQLHNFNGTLYFSTNDCINGYELWKSNGTSATTTLVKNIYSGANDGIPSTNKFISLGTSFYFNATTSAAGSELWKSGGTNATTTLVKDINSGTASSNPKVFATLGTNVLFTAKTPAGIMLYKSSGTSTGTSEIALLAAANSSINWNGGATATLNGYVYFFIGDYFWRTNGTVTGTNLITVPSTDIEEISTPHSSKVVVNNNLLFWGMDNTNGIELWKSDGTNAGTSLVKDINPGISSSKINTTPRNIVALNNTAYFFADNGTSTQLWKSDGTLAGTTMVKNITSPAPDQSPIVYKWLGTTENYIIFGLSVSGIGNQIWRSDGTESGTFPLASFESVYLYMIQFGNKVVFYNNSANSAQMTDGTVAGTGPAAQAALVNHLRSNESGYGESLIMYNGNAYYSKSVQAGNYPYFYYNYYLARCNSTDGGNETNIANLSSPILGMSVLNNVLYFLTKSPQGVAQLFKYDGTNVQLVKSISDSSPNAGTTWQMITYNGKLYFEAYTYADGSELWQSDGTTAGTSLVSNINSGAANSSPEHFCVMGNSLYFSATTNATGRELYKYTATSTPPPPTTTNIDLQLSLSASPASTLSSYSSVTYTLTVTNNSTNIANNVGISFPLPTQLAYQASSSSLGSYDYWNGTWNISTLAAGQSATAQLTMYNTNNTGNITVFCQVTAAGTTDSDSTPNNNSTNIPAEDDETAVTLALPGANEGKTEQGQIIHFNNVSPNPATDYINLNVHSKQNIKTVFSMYDITGRVVAQHPINLNESINQLQFDISTLPKGMYLLQSNLGEKAIKFNKF